MTVAAILKHKGHDVAHVAPSATIAEVVQQVANRGIGALLVLDEGGALVGIISERDVVRSKAANGAPTLDMTVDQLMTRNVRTATIEMSVQEAMQTMTIGRFRHLPVLDHGKLCGVVSIGDLLKTRVQQQEQEVDSLKAYVAGAD